MRKTVRLLALIFMLSLLFSGCDMLNIQWIWPGWNSASVPAESLPPEPTASLPTESLPLEPTESEATQPTESIPPETTNPLPTEQPTTEPAPINPEGELFSVEREGHYIFDEPSYDGRCVQGMPEGIYTVMETAWDDEGNTWGRLKSGLGWICLSDIRLSQEEALPVEIVEAHPELLNSGKANVFVLNTSEYYYKVAIFAYEKLTNVELNLVDVFGGDSAQKDLKWKQLSLLPDQPVVLQLEFLGDFTTYELTFLDASGEARAFYIMQSGRNGVIYASEIK